MELVADVMLACGALGAGLYCYVLSGRLSRFAALESGIGGAIAVLSAQVDDMTRALDAAKGAAAGSSSALGEQVARADAAARRLELLLASMHDLPEGEPPRDMRLKFTRRRAAREWSEAAE